MIPRIALKDIMVYKVLNIDSNGNFCTPITKDEIEIGKTYKGVFQESMVLFHSRLINYPQDLISSFFSKYIVSGYIHSHTYPIKDVYRTTVKCIIPRGTLYFIGDNFDIASRKLKYVEIIKL